MDRSRIHRLPDYVANQIAAGEVIERPAHVVKELVENSLDAGSHRIVCTVYGGGLSQIQIQDDGEGISPADLEAAVAPHATSKIQTVHDLLGITTLGFRGEALACIASISRMQVLSRVRDASETYQITAEGGRIGPVQRGSGRTAGTQITVEDLFYNVLSRRRFLGTPQRETLEIQQMMVQLALSHWDVEWILEIDSSPKWQLPRLAHWEQGIHRLRTLWGKRFAQEAYPIAIAMGSIGEGEGEWQIRGWLGGASVSRSDRLRQVVYLNGRAVRDPLLQRIMRLVYEPYMPPGRFPAYAIYIDAPPQAVDVNVHPTKHAVRFRSPRAVHDRIAAWLSRTLAQAWATPAVTGSLHDAPNFPETTAVPPSVASRRGAESFDAHHLELPHTAVGLYQWHGGYYLVDHHAHAAMQIFEQWQIEQAAGQSQAAPADWVWEHPTWLPWIMAHIPAWQAWGIHWSGEDPQAVRIVACPPVLACLTRADWVNILQELGTLSVFPTTHWAAYLCCAIAPERVPPPDPDSVRFVGARCRHGRYAVIPVPDSWLTAVVHHGAVR